MIATFTYLFLLVAKKKLIVIPDAIPVRKATPKMDSSEDSALSTSNPVKSANNWQIKLFLETPPSTLQR